MLRSAFTWVARGLLVVLGAVLLREVWSNVAFIARQSHVRPIRFEPYGVGFSSGCSAGECVTMLSPAGVLTDAVLLCAAVLAVVSCWRRDALPWVVRLLGVMAVLNLAVYALWVGASDAFGLPDWLSYLRQTATVIAVLAAPALLAMGVGMPRRRPTSKFAEVGAPGRRNA